MKSLHIKTDGTVKEIKPKDGKKFTLKELQKYVGGDIEIVRLRGRKYLVANEQGKLIGLPPNDKATDVWWKSYPWSASVIVGNVVITWKNKL